MTRINCVPVTTLSNSHLVAEYKEITRPLGKAQGRLRKGRIGAIPATYRLNTGHETFFFDKAAYILRRHRELYNEMLSRGMNPDREKFETIQFEHTYALIDTDAWNDWQPTPDDMYLNMARLANRTDLESVKQELHNETSNDYLSA